MPAIDQCEPQVIRALQKEGWIVVNHPFPIRIGKGKTSRVYADLRLQHHDQPQPIIVTEVKCFAENRPLLDEFYQAVGQYVVYRNALILNGIKSPLFLAVPSITYATFFQHPLIQMVRADVQLRLIVVDLNQEEIVTWIR